MANNYVDFLSPRGTAKYPKTSQAYSWNDKQNRSVPDEDGQFELKVVMSEAEAKPLLAKGQQAIKESGIKPKNLPWKKVLDKDTNEPTGDVEFTFRAYGKKKDGSLNKIAFYDGQARPAPGLKLTSGSIVKVSGYISVAKMGARLNMRDVQVIRLAEEQGKNPFAAEEDGFSYEADGNAFTAEDDNEAPFDTDDNTNEEANHGNDSFDF